MAYNAVKMVLEDYTRSIAIYSQELWIGQDSFASGVMQRPERKTS